MPAHRPLTKESSIRHRWPAGPLGWVSYLVDHKVRGFERPVPWGDLWHLENGGHGRPAFANGGCAVFEQHELDIIQALAKGSSDSEAAAEARASERAVRSVRRRFAEHLGASSAADIAAVASSNKLLS